MRVLAGDIGGTKTIIAIVEFDGSSARLVTEQRYVSAEWPGLLPMVEDFRRQTPLAFDAAGFGIAGPVIDRRCNATNLPWAVDARDVARDLGLARASLVNDFEAVAHGIVRLGQGDVAEVHPGV